MYKSRLLIYRITQWPYQKEKQHQQEEEKQNPAHWMMKLGILFEMATCEKTGKKYDLSEFKSPQIQLPFDGIFMHQCPQKSQHKWPWGDNVYRIVEEGMQDAGLLDKNYRVIGADRRSSRDDKWRLRRLGIENKIILEDFELSEITQIIRIFFVKCAIRGDIVIRFCSNNFTKVKFKIFIYITYFFFFIIDTQS